MNDEKLKEEVRKACEILKNGGIILYPTDTIWGIGCDATNEVAVKRVYELKLREDSKAMLVLLDDVGKLASYVEVPDVAYELLEVNDNLPECEESGEESDCPRSDYRHPDYLGNFHESLALPFP